MNTFFDADVQQERQRHSHEEWLSMMGDEFPEATSTPTGTTSSWLPIDYLMEKECSRTYTVIKKDGSKMKVVR